MKKILFFGLFCAFCGTLSAQSYKYCKLETIEPKLTSLQVIASIDTGQVAFTIKDRTVKDPDGKDKLFNSDVQVLELMQSKGWEVYLINVRENRTYSTIYLLRKEI